MHDVAPSAPLRIDKYHRYPILIVRSAVSNAASVLLSAWAPRGIFRLRPRTSLRPWFPKHYLASSESSSDAIMSRPSAIRATLKLSPAHHSVDVISVPPSGDCFYDCIHVLLLQSNDAKCRDAKCRDATLSSSSSSSPMPPPPGGRSSPSSSDAVPSSRRMREYVAGRLSHEQLDSYKLYAAAGLAEYDFATSMNSLDDLKRFAGRCGRSDVDAGPGKCLWADEFALRTISDWLHLTILIIDDQATRGGGGANRKRKSDGRAVEKTSSSSNRDNRFVCIGDYEQAVILHRSRRQHYNAVVIDDRPVMDGTERLPTHVRSLWAMVGNLEETQPESSKQHSDGLKYDLSKEHSAVESTYKLDEFDLGINTKPPSNNDLDQSATNSHNTKSSLGTLMSSSRTLGNFYCGCAGFSSPSWVGNFYPRSIVGHNSDRQLDHYQQHFRTVEINSTFYGIPSESTVRKWRDAFAKSFRVVVKAPSGLTHERPSLDFSVLSTFLSRMEGLKDSLACILIQCPRTLRVTTSQLIQMKTMMEREAGWYQGRIAFEFRNEGTYYDEEVRHFFRLNNISLVIHPNSLGRSTVGTSISGRGNADLLEYQPEELSSVASAGGMYSNFVYLRLHGFNDEHTGEYSVSQLEEIANQIHSWRQRCLDVFCFFLNDQDPGKLMGLSPKKLVSQPWNNWCAMPKNAKQLEHIVYRLSKEDTPDAPKKPKSTLLNFFGKR